MYFFQVLGEAYSFWKLFYTTSRGLQGRFEDVSITVASAAARGERDGELTPGATAALKDIAHIQRLIHQLFWSSFVKQFNALNTPEGLAYLLSRQMIKQPEYDSLTEAFDQGVPLHAAGLTWLFTRVIVAADRGEIIGTHAIMQVIFGKILSIGASLTVLFDPVPTHFSFDMLWKETLINNAGQWVQSMICKQQKLFQKGLLHLCNYPQLMICSLILHSLCLQFFS